MKTILILAACGLFIGLSCSKSSSPGTPPPNIHLTNGLLVYLPFSGNLADSSGNNNVVTAISGSGLGADKSGNANSALSQTTLGQYLTVTNNGSIKFDTAFTVSFDVMLTSQQQHSYAALVDNATSQSFSFLLESNPATQFSTIALVANANYTCNSYIANSNTTLDNSNFVPQIGIWYNIIFEFHKGNLTYYVNGHEVSYNEGGQTAISICPGSKLTVGGWWTNDPQSVLGKMDNFRLYNRVLTSDEIGALSKGF
ncbi:MAG: LamG domain-containing protein [Bacteroidota bacterium]|nr:LamG domain-containing protein [Bacteroidota bacterium]MDP4216750.1 LamG domain-containing protein [Bacteroidota bacterium]MDP4248028.1 LamG domain-containing protein [Bacteroidota bacterium]MDP4259111.1 LamG domain-containing protein [Bacteroidota bacterium]